MSTKCENLPILQHVIPCFSHKTWLFIDSSHLSGVRQFSCGHISNALMYSENKRLYWDCVLTTSAFSDCAENQRLC